MILNEELSKFFNLWLINFMILFYELINRIFI